MAAIKVITYKVPTFTPTDSGGTKETYANGATDFASVTNLNDRLEVVALQHVQGGLMQFNIRYRESLLITDKWLINYDGNDYKITAISKEKERNFYYKVIAKTIK